MYCLACIRSWRTEKGKTLEQASGDVLKRCPACRTLSNFVIPSDCCYAPIDMEAKGAFINDYKLRMGRLPCRHYINSPEDRRFCPFGKDCVSDSIQAYCTILQQEYIAKYSSSSFTNISRPMVAFTNLHTEWQITSFRADNCETNEGSSGI